VLLILNSLILAQMIVNGGGSGGGGGSSYTAGEGLNLSGTEFSVQSIYSRRYDVAALPATCTAGRDWFRVTGTGVISICGPTDDLFFTLTNPTGAVNFGSATSTIPFKSGTAVPGTCTTSEVFFETDATAGSNILLCTATNTYTRITPGGATDGIIGSFLNGAQAAASPTISYMTAYRATFSTGDASTGFPIPMAGVLRNLRIRTDGSAQSGTGSFVCVVRLNATTDTSITITLAAGASTQNLSDTTNSQAVVAGDLMNIKCTNNASVAAVPILFWSIQLASS
jgi:hypothetical protein